MLAIPMCGLTSRRNEEDIHFISKVKRATQQCNWRGIWSNPRGKGTISIRAFIPMAEEIVPRRSAQSDRECSTNYIIRVTWLKHKGLTVAQGSTAVLKGGRKLPRSHLSQLQVSPSNRANKYKHTHLLIPLPSTGLTPQVPRFWLG